VNYIRDIRGKILPYSNRQAEINQELIKPMGADTVIDYTKDVVTDTGIQDYLIIDADGV
jgi:hypothetical protein